MRYPRAATLAVFVTLALMAAVLAAPHQAATALDAYVLALGAIALGTLVLRTRELQRRPAFPLDRPLPSPPEGTARVAELERLERVVVLGSGSAFDVHYRVRPLFLELVSARLATRGIDLDRSPEAARAAAGEELWELVRPDVELANRAAPGLSLAQLARMTDALERI